MNKVIALFTFIYMICLIKSNEIITFNGSYIADYSIENFD